MSVYYSQSASGFYDDVIHVEIPADAVEITQDEHAALLAGQSAGQLIQADVDGKPILIDQPLDVLKRLKTSKIKANCGAAIVAGVDSDALGAVYHYPTQAADQQNINGLITESLLPDAPVEYLFWCADELGVWDRRSHTLAQIQVVGKAVVAHVKAQQAKYESLLSQIAAATTPEELDLVVW